ncbi:MAG TPA: hypothetical protein VF487_10840 [Chitinophagaceae bacterium]
MGLLLTYFSSFLYTADQYIQYTISNINGAEKIASLFNVELAEAIAFDVAASNYKAGLGPGKLP